MSATTDALPADSSPAYIRDSPTDREAVLHRRRKSAMRSLLAEFEQDIEPHIAAGHEKAIEDFKRSCRQKLNGLVFEATELMKLRPGESLNEHAVRLAEQLPSDANGGDTTS